ncbi:unnamed protein product, partial [Amoebophrya sp. A25]
LVEDGRGEYSTSSSLGSGAAASLPQNGDEESAGSISVEDSIHYASVHEKETSESKNSAGVGIAQHDDD